jgi:hypothetical protein
MANQIAAFVEKIRSWRAEPSPKQLGVADCDPYATARRGRPMTRRLYIAGADRAPLSERKAEVQRISWEPAPCG